MNRRRFLAGCAGLASALTVMGRVRADTRPIVIGIFPRRNVKVTHRIFSPMAEYLGRQLGREVRIQTTRTFEDFWHQVKLRKYDLVHYNQYHYIISHLHYGYDVIVSNMELGSATIAGSIIIRKDSGIEQISDLKGKTVLFGGGKRAMQSYISATWLLRQGGLKPGDYQEKFALNPPNTIISTYFRRADASGSGDVVMYLDNVTNRIDIEQLKFLARTPQMAHLPWAIRSDLPVQLKSDIRSILAGLNADSEGQAILQAANLDALVPVNDSDYDAHRKIVADVYGPDYGFAALE